MPGWSNGLRVALLGSVICIAPALAAQPAAAARVHEHAASSHSGSASAAHSGGSRVASAERGTSHATRGHEVRESRETGKRGDWVMKVVSRNGSREFFGRHSGAIAMHAVYMERFSGKRGFSKTGKARYALRGGYEYGYGGLQCVPFARAASGIELKGNAAAWWYAAAGVYQRGSRPEPGSVLNFRATGGMRLGHVAVVSAVLNARTIEVDHANWAGGRVMRGVSVVDVSSANDWSEVRVAFGHAGEYGSVYPTYGFIYDRPDDGVMVANSGARPSAPAQNFDEVAEAPAHPRVITPAAYRH